MGKLQNFLNKFSLRKSSSSSGPNWFATLDETRAPNVK